jgi:lipopolysaccharide/colanic/teichoic acid biosynthesis glycosyltransferase
MWILYKRILDLAVSIVFSFLLLPIIGIIACLVLFFDGFPVIFKQERMGRDWKKFNIYKFRTMRNDANKTNILVTAKGDNRVTKLGYWLRRSKVDELPQLFNVMKGDMSIVGPRPEVYKYAILVKEDYDEILKVRPGITDYASIQFRDEELILENEVDKEEAYIRKILPERVKLYKQYIVDSSLWTDIRIILNTILVIIRGNI